jgi:DNA invertase Pin-like site-specific DNA recombinase
MVTGSSSRLTGAKRIRAVALDVPTPWMMAAKTDEFTARMFEAVNGMLLDMLAAVARKDYDDRRRRQAQGQAKAKAAGPYRGRAEDTERNAGIAAMLNAGLEHDTGRNGLQPRHHCEDCEARSLITSDHHAGRPYVAALLHC